MAQVKTMHVYFISGLGADRRAFERLKLPDNFIVHYLDWIPAQKRESLDEYARRLATFIDTSQPFSIVGLSMGGMLAAAMTKFLQPSRTVLISSVACNAEFSPLLQLARKTRIYKLVPIWVLRHPTFIAYWLFGAKSKGEKKLMHYLISNSDPRFVKWAMGAILNWKNGQRPKTIFHIHGNADRILPVKYTQPDVIIEKGSHFMVWTKAGEVSRILTQALA